MKVLDSRCSVLTSLVSSLWSPPKSATFSLQTCQNANANAKLTS